MTECRGLALAHHHSHWVAAGTLCARRPLTCAAAGVGPLMLHLRLDKLFQLLQQADSVQTALESKRGS
jgi:hypothetical protein